MEEQMKEFFSELDMDFLRQKRKFLADGLRGPKRKNVLPAHLHSVMGSANLRLARGDTAGAIDLCLEVIRQAPHSPEPYLTLATIYEDTGDKQKLLQILIITAHLKKTDVDLWVKTAQLAADLTHPYLAVQCYHQASRLEPDNLTLLWCKAALYQDMSLKKKALDTYEQLLKSLPPTNGPDIIEVSKEMAQLYHSSEETALAVDTLHTAIQQHWAVAGDEAVHLLVELLIASKLYFDAYELITTFYNLIPAAPESASHDQSHDRSRDQAAEERASFQQMLSAALRVSVGESVEMEEEEEEAMGVGEGGGRGGEERREESRGGVGGRGRGVTSTSLPPFPPPSVKLAIPDSLLVDMRVKLAVCHIYLSLPLPPALLDPVLASPEEYGDLFLDLAEAYSDNGAPSDALPLLSALVHTERYNQAGVWLRHAECQHHLQDLEGAAMSYSRVLSLAPHHTNTRLSLATLYVQLGQVDDALALLESEHYTTTTVATETREEQREEEERGEGRGEGRREAQQEQRPEQPAPKEHSLEDLRLLLHKYTVLMNSGRKRECVEDGVELLSVLLRDIYHQKEKDIRTLLPLSCKVLRDRLKDTSMWVGPSSVWAGFNPAASLLSRQEWWRLFLTTCRGLFQLGGSHDHHRLVHFITCAATLRAFESPDTEMQFALFASSVYYILKEYSLTFTFIKRICIKLNQPPFWNILNSLPHNIKLQKFILRLIFKNPSTLPLLCIHANYSLVTSNYKFALCLFEQVHTSLPRDHLLSLCIATVYFNMASQNKATHRNTLVLQGLGFLHKYLKLRGRCQESMYNLGRAFHQIGIVHIACHFYRQVLTLEPENNNPKWRAAADLRAEAAFNLSLLYRAGGNRSLALRTLHQYCTL